MDAPSYQEVINAIDSAPANEAPGMSGLTGDLLKQLGPIATGIFVVLVQACMTQDMIPTAWMKGLIYPIPKGPSWSGKISEVRPITLLEHARKIMFTITVQWVTKLYKCFQVLPSMTFYPRTALTSRPLWISVNL
ncbi:hypothetical protein BGZ79_003900, partial [Entomortierella chlamydospora]